LPGVSIEDFLGKAERSAFLSEQGIDKGRRNKRRCLIDRHYFDNRYLLGLYGGWFNEVLFLNLFHQGWPVDLKKF